VAVRIQCLRLKERVHLRWARYDFHLLIGETKSVMYETPKLTGFPTGYNRTAVFYGKNDWITNEFGANLVGYGAVEHIRGSIKKTRNGNDSLVEVILAQNARDALRARRSVSHVQRQSIQETLKPVPSDTCCLARLFILQHCRQDFCPERVSSVLRFLSVF